MTEHFHPRRAPLELTHRFPEGCFSPGIDIECNDPKDASGNMYGIGEVIGSAGRVRAVSLAFESKASLFLEGSLRNLSEVLEVALTFRS